MDNEARKAFKFERGLKPNIKTKFSALRLRSYTKLVTQAMRVEDFVEFQPTREQ